MVTALYECIAGNHDLKLVFLAAVVCNLAAATSLTLLDHARLSARRERRLWLATAALAGGTGIWATHFIAMLAFSPGLASAYDIGLTGLSLLIGIGMAAAGFWIALRPGLPGRPGSAGRRSGWASARCTSPAWRPSRWRAASPGIRPGPGGPGRRAGFGSLALATTLRDGSVRMKLAGAGLMVAAICGLHFTAMTAAVITPDPSVAVSGTAVPAEALAVAIALASSTILVLAFAGLWLHLRDERRSALESDRMRGLANAAAEGLVVCDGDRIVTVNDSFADLVGRKAAALTGASLAGLLAETEASDSAEAPEAQLRCDDGSLVPVQVIRRVIDFAGRPHAALAVRDLRARKRAEARIAYLAHHDALTGVPNRTSFNARLAQEIALAQAAGRPLAVLCADLDRFKEVNDLFGHAAGDALLRAVCAAITAVLSPGQMLARLGGDEFAVLAPNLDAAGAEALGEAILAALRQAEAGPVGTTGGVLAAASLGIALFPHDGEDAQTLMVQADTALYRAKQEGRGRLSFYEARMGVQVRERRQIEHDLRHAVERGEMRVVYQPQNRIDTGEAVGFEALLRWDHPLRGSVPPNHFIPIAEETGTILDLGDGFCARPAARPPRGTSPCASP